MTDDDNNDDPDYWVRDLAAPYTKHWVAWWVTPAAQRGPHPVQYIPPDSKYLRLSDLDPGTRKRMPRFWDRMDALFRDEPHLHVDAKIVSVRANPENPAQGLVTLDNGLVMSVSAVEIAVGGVVSTFDWMEEKEQQQAEDQERRLTFGLALHPRVGQASSVYRNSQSRFYEEKLNRVILDFMSAAPQRPPPQRQRQQRVRHGKRRASAADLSDEDTVRQRKAAADAVAAQQEYAAAQELDLSALRGESELQEDEEILN